MLRRTGRLATMMNRRVTFYHNVRSDEREGKGLERRQAELQRLVLLLEVRAARKLD